MEASTPYFFCGIGGSGMLPLALIMKAKGHVVAARRVGAALVKRADLLAELFNAAPVAIGVAGTSGKSTTTGMIAWILEAAGKSPTVMNGAVMKDFVDAKAPFASSVVGKGDIFVSEVDESDGSIALYSPRIAVLNNLALKHKWSSKMRTRSTALN